jgi:hypothetical protein
MSKRIGKYKISKKESALSALDGGLITGKGIQGTIVSAETTLAAAAGTTDISFALPAGALVKDFGFVVTSAVGGGSGGGTMAVKLGTSEGGDELLASATVADSNSTIAAGASMSVLNAVEADASGAAFTDFTDAATLYSATARSVHARFTQGTDAAAADGKVIAFVDYIIVS